ncbi:serine/threonine-protein kinase [Streptomyces canus]|uniref:serine/threonine-protein kinase n=1 Tax=Streptomyces canus TaxID=58343 RepID=UPI0035933EF3
MGRVWRAADEMLDREVAVKEMRIDGLDAEDARTRRERTLREARATARIDHPNVVRIYDVVDEGERLWIVMELVAGRSLERLLAEDGPLGPLAAARIGVGLVTALRQVHARGVLHRDIKPGNVLVERNGHRVVLTDFGIAAIQDAKALTMVGMLVGSPDYMAPERISGRPQGPPSDIWSLGATLCAAMGGHSPFSRDTTLATLHAVLYEEPELPTAAGPLRDILAALLEKDPDVRPGLEDLETALRPVAFPPPTPTVAVTRAPQPQETAHPRPPDTPPPPAPTQPRTTNPTPQPHPDAPEHLATTRPGDPPEPDRHHLGAVGPEATADHAPKPAGRPAGPERAAGPGRSAEPGRDRLGGVGPGATGGSLAPELADWPAGPGRSAEPGRDGLGEVGPEVTGGALAPESADWPGGPEYAPGPGDSAGSGRGRLGGVRSESVGWPAGPEWAAGPERAAGPGDLPESGRDGLGEVGPEVTGGSLAPESAGWPASEPGDPSEPGRDRLGGGGSEVTGGPLAPEAVRWPAGPESESARESGFGDEPAGGAGAESSLPSAGTPRTPAPDRVTPRLPWAPHESPTPAYLDASRVPMAPDPRRSEPEPDSVHDAIPQRRTAPARTQRPATEEPTPALNAGNASTEAAASTSSEVRSETPVSRNRSEAVTERRPVHEPPLGMEPGELPGPARPTGQRRPHPHPHRRTGLLAAAAVVTAGAVVAVVLLMNSGSPGGNQAGSSRTPSSIVSGTPSPTVEGTSRPQSLPPGAHREAGGFAWATPEGWRRDVKTGAEVHYTSPDGRQELVAKSSLARGDLMETWQTSEENAHQGEDYQKIRLEETKFRDHPAVVWEYTFTLKGTKWHARLLGFNADGKSYQINTWYQPDIENQAVKTYDKVTDSFTIL